MPGHSPHSAKGKDGLPCCHSAVALLAAEAGALDEPLLSPAHLEPAGPGAANGTANNAAAEQGERRGDGSADGSGGGGGGGVGEQGGQAARILANLLNSGIGSSTVAMPMVTRTLGAGLAAGTLLGQATLGVLANHILSREGSRSGAASYHDLMTDRYGKWGGRAVALAQMLNSLGKCVVWLIILADLIVGSKGGGGLLPELLQAAGHGDLAEGGGLYLRRWPWILALALLATPVVSVRSLNKLSGISMLGDVAVALMMSASLALTVVAARRGEAHPIRWLPSKEEAGVGSNGALALEVASVVPVLMGAAFTQNNIQEMARQLRPYRQGLLDATQAAARGLTIAVFLAIGLSNYAVFGTDLQPDVLLNYSAEGLGRLLGGRGALALSVAVKASFLVNGLVGLPMYLYPFQRNMWAALPRESAEERMGDRRSFALTNIVSLAGCTAVAILVPTIWKPLKLLGGTAVSCMAFIFPGLVALKVGGTPALEPGQPERGAWDRALWALGWLLVAVGLLQAAASIASQFI